MDKGFMGETGKALGRRMVRLKSIPFFMLGATALFVGCMGGSDGVENPKMSLEFRPDGGGAVSGRLSMYGANLNPAVDSAPMLAKDFTAGNVEVTSDEVETALNKSLAGHGKDTTAHKDTTLYFNLVATSGDMEAFVGGFALRRAGKTVAFSRTENGIQGAFASKYAKRFLLPKAVKFTGHVGVNGAILGLDYIFIPGSPYHSAIKDSGFSMSKMSPGSYGIIGADKDSSKYYESPDSLSTSDTAYTAKAWGVIPFIPDH